MYTKSVHKEPERKLMSFIALNPKTTALTGIFLTQVPLLLSFKSDGPLFIFGMLLLGYAAFQMFLRDNNEFGSLLLRRDVLLVYASTFSMAWCALVFVDFYSFEYNNFDTGYYANQIAHFRDYGTLYSSIIGVHALGEHFNPHLILLTPLFSLWNSFLWLPLIKLVAFFSCPLLLVLIGKHILGKESRLIYFAPLLWIVHEYLYRTMMMEFQPSSLALPFVLLSFYLAMRNHSALLIFSLLFLLGFKEHMALAWLSVGIYLIFFERRRLLGTSIFILGIAAGLIIYLVVMPEFAGDWPTSHRDRFAPLVMPVSKLLLILKALFSVAFIPLLVPKTLLVLLPAFALSLVSGHELMLTYSYHYQDLPLTVLFVTLILGLKAWKNNEANYRQNKPKLYCATPLLVCLVLIGTHTRYPMRAIKKQWPRPAELTLYKEIQEARTMLDKSEQLWILDFLGPHFFDFPKMRSIQKPRDPFKRKEAHSVVFSDQVLHWPLSAGGYQKLKQEVGANARKGRYSSRDFEYLRLFSTHPLSSISSPTSGSE